MSEDHTDTYKIIMAPDPVLKQTAGEVVRVDDSLRLQFDKMHSTMRKVSGIGLAANQVGLLNRVFVMQVEQYSQDTELISDTGPVFLANPQIVWRSEESSVLEEGCLSLPGQYAQVERAARVRVKYLDYDGKEVEMEGSGLVSHVIQHELDHLNGVLFVDYLSRLKRDMMIRRVRKIVKAADSDAAKI